MALKIKLVKSLVGRKDSHIATAASLGLRKIGAETTRGKIKEISYLVEVTEE